MAKQQNNNEWLKILVAAAEIGYFINRLNNNKLDAEYVNNLMLRLGLYGLLSCNRYDDQQMRQLTAGLNNALTHSTLNDLENQKKLTQKQKKSFITLVDNKPKVVELLTNKENKTEALELKKIVEEVSTKNKFLLDNNQSEKLDSISKELEKKYDSKKMKFKLDEIFIKDYRILKDFKIKFDKNISIIIGENGSGKSTLIEYISNVFARMFLESMRKEVYLPEYDLGKFEFKYSFYNNEENIKVVVKNELDFFSPIYNSESSTRWPDRFVVSYSGITGRLKKMVKENFEDTFVRIINNDGTKYSISPNEFNLPKNRFYYADSKYLSLIYCALHFSSNPEKDNLVTKIDVDISRCEIEFHLGDTYKSFKDKLKGKIAPLFFDTLLRVHSDSTLVGINELQDMFHEFKKDISSQEVFDILYYLKHNNLIEDIKISWKNESGSFDLEHISEGQKQELMTLGLSLVFDSPNTLFLLDEPDTYLHPKWQREFISSLTKALEKGGCAIVTTHSPLLLGNAENAQVNILKKGKITQKVPKYYGRTVSDILFELMGGVEERESEIAKKLDKLSVMVEEEMLDESQKLYNELCTILGENDSDLYKLKILLDELKYQQGNETDNQE